MLLSPLAHLALVAFALVGAVLAGLLVKRRRLEAALLLWAVPVALTASVADLLLLALDQVRPGSLFSDPGGHVRFAVACVVALPPVEILYQRIATLVAGGGAHRVPLPESEPAPPAP